MTPPSEQAEWLDTNRLQGIIAAFTLVAIALHLWLRYGLGWEGEAYGIAYSNLPLIATLLIGGTPLVLGLLKKLLRGDFGSDLLAGLSIITAVLLGEYLAGVLVVLMLSGGEALEGYAVRRASSVLEALARRMPSVAHRLEDDLSIDIPLEEVRIGDRLVIFPHETCPVDGTVLEGHGAMDESYLTGEPYILSKAPGSAVLSGAINGEVALTVRADRLVEDSRYAKIMEVMRASEQRRPRLRRLGDQLGAYYTPLALVLALAAWMLSGEVIRFLAVLVVATPCPLLIAIPVSIIGSISLAAQRGIIIKDPAALEVIDTCRTAIFDKTGTLTYGEPRLVHRYPASGFDADQILLLVASLERYSKHPLARAILRAAEETPLSLLPPAQMSERPGDGLRGTVDGHRVRVTNRATLLAELPATERLLPPRQGGLECVVMVDDRYAGVFQFRDEPRQEGASFIQHLAPRHRFGRVMIISGDQEEEVRYLAERVGIQEVYAGKSPEQKLALVQEETRWAPTVFLGDGINDAPALTAATVGIAFGKHSDITAEAAGVVIMDTSLQKVDELLHISRRMRSIALQSAVGGMGLSVVGMLFAAAGYLPPVAGALAQEAIDVLAVLNALRAVFPPRTLTDFTHQVPA